MTPKITLMNPCTDDERISPEMLKDFDKNFEIKINKDEDAWDEGSHVYSVFMNYGGYNTEIKSMIFDVSLDDLEMFAYSLLKSIEMLRRDYKDVIQEKIKNGELL